MNPAVRRVGIVVVLLFVALGAQLTYLQVLRADDLETHPGNIRVFLRDVRRDRGQILTSDGEIAARSELVDDEFEQQRTYPLGALTSHLVGYQSIVFGNVGVEATYNDELIGRDVELQLRNVSDFLSGSDPTGTVVLSLSKRAQELARDGLRGRRGSVVVLDVRSGAIVAAYSEPTFDPKPLTDHDLDRQRAYRFLLESNTSNPALARVWRERYAPGSTFKIVTTAIALDAGVATPERDFPRLREISLPQTDRPLANFGGRECGGTLAESFRVSCNTTFARLGLDLGERLAEGIERFGLNTNPPDTDLNPRVVRSVGPERGSFELDQPSFAQAAIGQGQVAVTPLEMAMTTAAIANGGVMMVPHVAMEVRDPDGVVVRRIGRSEWRRAMTPSTAATLTQLMRDVVERGTGTAAQIPGIPVAGKTGTAQAPPGAPHAWFVGFAPADEPVYAIAVLVERGGDVGDEATGGRVAAPIAAQVLGGLLGG